MADDDDLFSQLLGMSWRGVGFPVVGFRQGLAHDLVEHRFMAKDGAHVEATGRQPLVFQARALFRNGVAPAPGESNWIRPLYPDGWRAFMAAAADKTSADLVHPELGKFRCKLRQADTDWDLNRRDGVDVEVSWVETTDDPNGLASLLAGESPIKSAARYAAGLDDFLYKTKNKQLALALTGPADPGAKSLEDYVFAIEAAVDQASILSRQAEGRIASVIARADRFVDAVNRFGQPGDWLARRTAESLIESLLTFKKTYVSRGKSIRFYATPTTMTVTTIAAALKIGVADVLSLNPDLSATPSVPPGTVVTYAR
jgi:hypothetical protein